MAETTRAGQADEASSRDADAAAPVARPPVDAGAQTATMPPESAAPEEAEYDLALTIDGLPLVHPKHYLMYGEFARGGIGRIIRARDRRLGREVAIKELLPGHNQATIRFLREAAITARLQHPSIVPVHEAGRWPTGKPFYAMKFLSGRSLRQAIHESRSAAERLALVPNVVAVADAIAYAHSQGVIHRDLKPANVILGEFGETVVIDWGLAKSLSDGADEQDPHNDGPYRRPDDATKTRAGAVLGTPAFMSPEQARGERADARSDVYALGGLLYSVLTGQAPYAGTSSEAIVQTVVAGPPARVHTVEPSAPPDLVAIVNKAMARDPDDRYATATELAADLKRFSLGQLVSSRRYSAVELFIRWVKRRRAIVALSAVFISMAAVAGTFAVRKIVTERSAANEARRRAEADSRALTITHAAGLLATDPSATLAWLAKLQPTTDPLVDDRVYSLAAQAASYPIARTMISQPDRITHVGYLQPSGLLVTTSFDGTIRLYDTDGAELDRYDTGVPVLFLIVVQGDRAVCSSSTRAFLASVEDRRLRVRAHETAGHLVEDVGASQDGHLVALARPDGGIELWDTHADATTVLSAHSGQVRAVSLSKDGRFIGSGGQDGGVQVWELDSLKKVFEARHDGPVHYVDFFPDGDRLVSTSDDGSIRVHSITQNRTSMILRGHKGAVMEALLSPDQRSLASVGEDNRVVLWSLADATGTELVRATHPIISASFSGNASLLAVGDDGGTVYLANTQTQTVARLLGHTRSVGDVAFSPEGHTLASAANDHSVRFWSIDTPADHTLGVSDEPIDAVRYSQDGRFVAAGSDGAVVYLFDRRSRTLRTLRADDREIFRISFSPDSALLAGASYGGGVHVWDTATGAERPLDRQASACRGVLFSPVTTELLSGRADGSVLVWDSQGKSVVIQTHAAQVTALAYSADGTRVASGDDMGTILVSSRVERGATPRALNGHHRAVRAVTFIDPDALVSASDDGTVRVWSLANATSRTVADHGGSIWSMAYATSSNLLACGGRAMHVSVYDLTNRSLRRLSGPTSFITRVKFSPDARLLVAGSETGNLYMWRTDNWEMSVLHAHDLNVDDLDFAPGSDEIASVGRDGRFKASAVKPRFIPRSQVAFASWLASQTEIPAETLFANGGVR